MCINGISQRIEKQLGLKENQLNKVERKVRNDRYRTKKNKRSGSY